MYRDAPSGTTMRQAVLPSSKRGRASASAPAHPEGPVTDIVEMPPPAHASAAPATAAAAAKMNFIAMASGGS